MTEAQLKARYAESKDIQDEFRTEGAFVAYVQAVDAGAVRVFEKK
jgi:hypothetical protein